MLDIGYHYNTYEPASSTYDFLVDTTGGGYDRIQDAIDDAGPGDVIMVTNDVYMENIYVGPEKGDLIIQSFIIINFYYNLLYFILCKKTRLTIL